MPKNKEKDSFGPMEDEPSTVDTGNQVQDAPAQETQDSQPGENQGNDSFLNSDTFDNPDMRALTTTQTATDAYGIERIVAPATIGWQPAPTEATEEEKKAAEERNRLFAMSAEQRKQNLVGDKMADQPGNDGSQTVPAS